MDLVFEVASLVGGCSLVGGPLWFQSSDKHKFACCSWTYTHLSSSDSPQKQSISLEQGPIPHSSVVGLGCMPRGEVGGWSVGFHSSGKQ